MSVTEALGLKDSKSFQNRRLAQQARLVQQSANVDVRVVVCQK